MTIDELKEFKEYDSVQIISLQSVNSFKRQIIQKEQENEKYQIYIYFCYDSTIQQKKTLINMIDKLNINHKVGKIWINIKQNNIFDKETIRIMNDKYINTYYLNLHDFNDSIDNSMY